MSNPPAPPPNKLTFFARRWKQMKRWWSRFFVEEAYVPEHVRGICDRYGEQIVTDLLSGTSPSLFDELNLVVLNNALSREYARAWLAEEISYNRRRDHLISLRDLILELVIIAMIGWEIHLSLKQEDQQATNFKSQQEALNNLAKSSRDTASILGSLKTTTETMNGNIVSLQGPVERNATAAEASSATASKSLVVSERAYVACAFSSPSPPKAAEKWAVTVALANTGKTPALELESTAAITFVEKGTSDESARKQAFSIAPAQAESKTILSAGQHTTQIVETSVPIADVLVADIDAGRVIGYVFVDVKYLDTFNRKHRVEQCGFYLPSQKQLVGCKSLNKAD